MEHRNGGLMAGWIRRVAGVVTLAVMPLQAGAAAGPAYVPGVLPQVQWQQDQGRVQVTLLGAGWVHLAWGPRLVPGQVWTSPMVARQQFGGVDDARWDAVAGELRGGGVAVRHQDGCWQVSGGDGSRLADICVDNWQARRLRLTLQPHEQQHVLGLGEHLDETTSPDWNGRRRLPGHPLGNAMVWSGPLGAAGNMQVPVAYALGPKQRDFAFFLDTPYAVRADFSVSPWQVETDDGSAGLFLWTGGDLASLRRGWLDLVGHPPVPPLKAFGLWLSEFGFDHWNELNDKLATLRESRFPIDGAVLDLQWFGGIHNGSTDTPMGRLAWDRNAFPDAGKRVRELAAQGVGLMLIEESYVGLERDEFKQLADQRGLAMSCPPPCTEATVLDANPWWGVGGMIDWSSEAAGHAWHQAKRRALIDDGILGHWTDLGEPEQFDEQSIYHGYDWYGLRVSRHRDVHNLYNFFWSRSLARETAASHPDRRPWILSRSGTAGSQRFGVSVWSGDVQSSFEALQAQMRAQSNMSLSGFDYYGSDVGGFHRGRIGRAELDRLYTRWMASSALLDVPLRPHVMNLCNCWETAPDRVGDRASNLANIRLRYQLIPYLYGLAHAAWRDGDPVFGPLALAFGDSSGVAAVSGTKLMGPWLLFAPPATAADTVDVWLPRGRWYDFHRPGTFADGQDQVLTRPVVQDGVVRAPLYLRQGAIVPMLARVPDHLGDLQPGRVRWFDDLVVRLVPAPRVSRFVLVEDDGVSRAYERGVVSRTELELQSDAAGGWRLSVRPDNRTGQKADRHWVLDVVTDLPAPARLTLDGRVLPELDGPGRGVGWWRVPGGVTVELGHVPVDRALQLVATAGKVP